jgi:hypothetical protein
MAFLSPSDSGTMSSKPSESPAAGFQACFLEGLPEGTPQYRFVNVPDLQRKVALHQQDLDEKRTSNQFVVFLDIPDRAVQKISDESSSICRCRVFFEHQSNILIIKMPSGPRSLTCLNEFGFKYK